MKGIFTKRQLWLLAYSLIIFLLSINYLRNSFYDGGFDNRALSSDIYVVDKELLNLIFFEQYPQLSQIKSQFPEMEMNLKGFGSNFRENLGRNNPKVVFIIPSNDYQNFIDTLNRLKFKYDYEVIQQ